MMFRRLTLAATALALVATATLSPATASARLGGVDLARTEAEKQQLRERYGSLSSAMADFYAAQRGNSLAQLAADSPETMAQLLGIDETLIAGLDLSNSAALNNSLSGLGVTTLDAATGTGFEGVMAARAAGWFEQMAALRAPELVSAGTIDPKLATSLPREGLRYGLFVNKSLTALVTDHPDVFTQVSKSGKLDAAGMTAWRNAMLQGFKATMADPSKALVSGCGAAQLAAMATGSASETYRLLGSGAGGCTPCITSGLYLHDQTLRLVDPSRNSVLGANAGPNTIAPGTWSQLQPWQQEAIKQANPKLGTALKGTLATGPTSGCGASSAATSATVRSNMGGAIGSLLQP
jgi:hypothetical protein